MRKSLFYSLLICVIFFCASVGVFGREIFVGPNREFSSLAEAIHGAGVGDIIHLATGVYQEPSESYPIEINVPLTITGEAGTVLKGVPFKSILNINSPDVTIENVAFHILRWGIVNTGDRLSLKNCHFLLADSSYRVSSNGVWLAGVTDCNISGCEFEGCGICIAGPPLSPSSQGLPVLTGLFEVGEDIDFFTTHTIENNTINGKPFYYYVNKPKLKVPRDAGGLIAVGCDNIIIQGIDVSDNSMGIQLVYSDDAHIMDLTADRCGIFGVYVAKSKRSILRNVRCVESNHGVDLRAVQNAYVTDCETYRCEQGIFLSVVTDSIVDNCKVVDGGSGYFVAAGAQNQISRCLARGNGNGIYIQNEEDMLIADNIISKNTVAGIRFLRSGGQIINNEFLDNWVGALIAETGPFTLYNNKFNDTACTALYLRDIKSGKISHNSFDDSGQTALEMDDYITESIILQNSFLGGKKHMVDRTGNTIGLENNIWEN